VPIIDLNLRFGRAPRRFYLEDCVVVLEWSGIAVGIVVNEVQNVRDIAPHEMAPVPSYGAAAQADVGYITGLVKSDDQVVMLLHLENLIRISQSLTVPQGPIAPPRDDTFCPEATPQEMTEFRERALSLAQPLDNQEPAGLPPLAVVRLGAEFFGIELVAIREFAELRNVTPVPCCPKHVVGQMNLRGDLITLIDVAGALGLATAGGWAAGKVVVVNIAVLSVGVLVDEVLDVIYLSAMDVAPTRAAARGIGQAYLRGTAPHGGKMLTVLDLTGLLMHDNLVVNERP